MKVLIISYIEKTSLFNVDNNFWLLELKFIEVRCEREDGEVETEGHQPLRDCADNVIFPASILWSPLGGVGPVELGPGHLCEHHSGDEGGGVEECQAGSEDVRAAAGRLEGGDRPGEDDAAPQPGQAGAEAEIEAKLVDDVDLSLLHKGPVSVSHCCSRLTWKLAMTDSPSAPNQPTRREILLTALYLLSI